MEEDEDYDSDSTVLLADFVNKPQKIDAKSYRLSSLHDKSKATNLHVDENDESNNVTEVSVNRRTDVSPGKYSDITNWRTSINNYFARMSYNNDVNIKENGNRGSIDFLSKKSFNLKNNTVGKDNACDIIYIDSDEELQSSGKSQDANVNRSSGVNELTSNSEIKVNKPAAISSRRANTNIVQQSKLHSTQKLEMPKIRVLKPSAINARRSTIHFDQNYLQDQDVHENVPFSLNRQINDPTVTAANPATTSSERASTNVFEQRIINPSRNDTQKLQENDNFEIRFSRPSVTRRATVNLDEIILNRRLHRKKFKLKSNLESDTATQTDKGIHEIESSTMAKYPTTAAIVTLNNSERRNEASNPQNIQTDKGDCKNVSGNLSEIPSTVADTIINNNARSNDAKSVRVQRLGENTVSSTSLNNSHENCANIAKIGQDDNKKKINLLLNITNKSPDKKETCNPRDGQNEVTKSTDKLSKDEYQKSNALDNKVTGITEKSRNALKTFAELQSNVHVRNQDSNVVSKIDGQLETDKLNQNQQKQKHDIENNKSKKMANETTVEHETKNNDKQILRTSDRNQATREKQSTGLANIQDNQTTSETQTKVHDKQRGVTQASSEQRTAESVHGQERVERIKTTSAANLMATNSGVIASSKNKKLMIKFHIYFFTQIKEYILKRFPESVTALDKLIQTLDCDARNGIVHTDVQCSCPNPNCKIVSNYSSCLVKNKENGTNNDESRKCVFCKGMRKIHTSYLKRSLSIKNPVGDLNLVANRTPAERDNVKEPIEQCRKSQATKIPSGSSETIRKTANNPVSTSTLIETGSSISNKDTPVKMALSSEESKTDNHGISPKQVVDSVSSPKLNISLNPSSSKPVTNKFMHNTETLEQTISSFSITKKRANDGLYEAAGEVKRMKTNSNSKNPSNENLTTKDTSSPESRIAQNITSNNEKGLNDEITSLGSDNTQSVVVISSRTTNESENIPNINPAYTRKSDTIGSTINDIRRNKDSTSDKVSTDTSVAVDVPKTNLQIVNSEEIDEANQSTIKSLDNCFTQLKNTTKNKDQEENNQSPKGSASKHNSSNELTNHEIVIKYVCNECTRMYKYSNKLLEHLKDVHKMNRSKIPENCVMYECPFCRKLLKFINYNKHLKHHHSQECKESGRAVEEIKKEKISNREEIGRNKSESSRFKYHCLICNIAFESKHAGNLHRKQTHTNPEDKHKHLIKKIGFKSNSGHQEKRNDEDKVRSALDNNSEDRSSKPEDCSDLVGTSETNAQGITTSAANEKGHASSEGGGKDKNTYVIENNTGKSDVLPRKRTSSTTDVDGGRSEEVIKRSKASLTASKEIQRNSDSAENRLNDANRQRSDTSNDQKKETNIDDTIINIQSKLFEQIRLTRKRARNKRKNKGRTCIDTDQITVSTDVSKSKDDSTSVSDERNRDEVRSDQTEFDPNNSPNVQKNQESDARINEAKILSDDETVRESKITVKKRKQRNKTPFNDNTEITGQPEQHSNINNAEMIIHEDDRIEIDLINRLLEELGHNLQNGDSGSDNRQNVVVGPENHRNDDLGTDNNQGVDNGHENHQNVNMGPANRQNDGVGPDNSQNVDISPENGPRQTALYLCAKCNTCVPHLEIEKHVSQRCTISNFMTHSCVKCNCTFSTSEMLRHHEIYHTGEDNQPFKTIVFNDRDDEEFNSKLIKLKRLSKEQQRIIDIYRCICGLCFTSLKKFKFHFLDCESQTNNGAQCPKCTEPRRFPPTELEDHLSNHRSILTYEFRTHVVFQTESNCNNIQLSNFETINRIPQKSMQVRSNEEIISQNTNVESRQGIMTEPLVSSRTTGSATELMLNGEDDLFESDNILNDESLSQNTNEQTGQESLDVLKEESDIESTAQQNRKDFDINNDTLHVETLLQDMNEDTKLENGDEVEEELGVKNTSQPIQVTPSDKDIKREMLKDETLSQDINQENPLGYLDNTTTEQDSQTFKTLNNATQVPYSNHDLLKEKSLTQNTCQDNLNNDASLAIDGTKQNATHISFSGEDLNIKMAMLNFESMNTHEQSFIVKSENSQENVQESLGTKITGRETAETTTNDVDLSINTNEEIKERITDTLADNRFDEESSQEVMVIEDSVHPIVIDDSDDGNVQVIVVNAIDAQRRIGVNRDNVWLFSLPTLIPP